MLLKFIELGYSIMSRLISHYAIIIIDKWLRKRTQKQEQSDSKDAK